MQVDVRRRLIVSFLAVLLVVPALAADRPVIVCFGDSITAGYGLKTGQAYPDFLQEKLDSHGYHYKVINQGTSGATTKDAVASLPSVLHFHPEIVIVEFGGNDGLRGLPTEQTRKNLETVLTTLEGAHIKILLAGITLPPDYGPDYIHAFEQVFSICAHDLQGPDPHPRHHPAGRHPSHRQRLQHPGRHHVRGAQAAAA